VKAGVLSAVLVGVLLLFAGAANAATQGALVFDSNRCDQGGAPSYDGLPGSGGAPCQESIFRVNADGSGLTRLTSPGIATGPNSFDDFWPTWSPNGSHIVFLRVDQTGDYPTGNEGWPNEITVMNSDGSGAHAIRTGHSLQEPVWSPDGGAIAYSKLVSGRGNQLRLIGPNGSDDRALTPEDFVWFRDTQWTPDGRRITGLGSHWRPSPDAQEPGHEFEPPVYTDFGIWSVNRDGSDFRQLTAGDINLGYAAFSPDGRYLAMAVNTPNGTGTDLFTVRLDGSDKTLRSDVHTAFAPTWSPFGPTLFFVGNGSSADTPAGTWGIRSIDLRGGGSAAVTDSKWRDGKVAWNPLGAEPPAPARDDDPPLVVLGSSFNAASATAGSRSKLHAASAARASKARLPFIALDRTGIKRIGVAVGKRAHGKCRFLRADGRLGTKRACKKASYVRYHDARSWRKLTAGLPAGTYEVRFRTTDVKGHRTAHPRRRVIELG
jgi:Tol biopolymer transport system component